MAAFDELKALGLDAFVRKHDPYWDVPLNENLPQPVIDLPLPAVVQGQSAPAPAPKAKKGKASTSMNLFDDHGPLVGDPVPAKHLERGGEDG